MKYVIVVVVELLSFGNYSIQHSPCEDDVDLSATATVNSFVLKIYIFFISS